MYRNKNKQRALEFCSAHINNASEELIDHLASEFDDIERFKALEIANMADLIGTSHGIKPLVKMAQAIRNDFV